MKQYSLEFEKIEFRSWDARNGFSEEKSRDGTGPS